MLRTQVRFLFQRAVGRIHVEIRLNRFHALNKKAVVSTFYEICVLSNVIFGASCRNSYFLVRIDASVNPIIEIIAIIKFIMDWFGLFDHTIDKFSNS